jgi:hypothetical protein
MALKVREEIKFEIDLFFATTSVEGMLKMVDWATAFWLFVKANRTATPRIPSVPVFDLGLLMVVAISTSSLTTQWPIHLGHVSWLGIETNVRTSLQKGENY